MAKYFLSNWPRSDWYFGFDPLPLELPAFALTLLRLRIARRRPFLATADLEARRVPDLREEASIIPPGMDFNPFRINSL